MLDSLIASTNVGDVYGANFATEVKLSISGEDV